MNIPFYKIQASGNDFIVVNYKDLPVSVDLEKLSLRLCNRHFGIGSDGLLILEPSQKAHWRMRMYNSLNGLEAHCGNGMRCLARYIYDHQLVSGTRFTLETPRGVHYLEIILEGNRVSNIGAEMGIPILERKKIPVAGEGPSPVLDLPVEVKGKTYLAACVSMGNPHAIFFCEDPRQIPLETLGPLIENHSLFPDKTNVEFIKVVSPSELIMRVWERGGGITLACGSGACASMVAARLKGYVDSKVQVRLPGGSLKVHWESINQPLYIYGLAENVFSGVFPM